MAYCPKCSGVMPATAIQCPHCENDFAESDSPKIRQHGAFVFYLLRTSFLSLVRLALLLALCLYFSRVSSHFLTLNGFTLLFMDRLLFVSAWGCLLFFFAFNTKTSDRFALGGVTGIAYNIVLRIFLTALF